MSDVTSKQAIARNVEFEYDKSDKAGLFCQRIIVRVAFPHASRNLESAPLPLKR